MQSFPILVNCIHIYFVHCGYLLHIYCIIFMYYYITTITLQHGDIEKYHLYNETMSRKLRH